MGIRNIARQSALVSVLAVVATQRAPAQAGPVAPDSVHVAPPSITTGRKSYLVPALEVPVFLALLSGGARVVYPNEIGTDGKKVYFSTAKSSWDHLKRQSWIHDEDPFDVNQFRHPYLGATMYGLARSTGNGFWTSLIYSDVGSFMWEMAGETGPPSVNDIITTGQAGSLLGEALFRTANIVRRDKPGGTHQHWRGFFADLIDPSRGFNRRVLGNDYRTQLPDTAPAVAWQLRLGTTKDALARDYSAPGTFLRQDATVEYSMTYGLPGKAGYDYRRPLSYFDFQVSVLFNPTNPVENVMLRGLLFGKNTGSGATSRGIWGLYGSYDYISPYLFRVSSSALSLGTTQQHWITRGLALQSSLLGGVGYGAAGSNNVIPSTPTSEAIRDYHFGVTPQGLAALRLIAGDRVMLDAVAREYYVSGLGSDDTQGSETVFRGNVGLTVRIIGGHALGARWVLSTRDAKYGTFADKKLSEQTVTVSYSFLGANRFSAVKWK